MQQISYIFYSVNAGQSISIDKEGRCSEYFCIHAPVMHFLNFVVLKTKPFCHRILPRKPFIILIRRCIPFIQSLTQQCGISLFGQSQKMPYRRGSPIVFFIRCCENYLYLYIRPVRQQFLQNSMSSCTGPAIWITHLDYLILCRRIAQDYPNSGRIPGDSFLLQH